MFQTIMPIKISDIAKNTQASFISGNEDTVITAITTNSRKAVPGCLFVPIKGENADGHNYIQNAIDNGASAVVSMEGVSYSSTVLKSSNTRLFLSEFASYYRSLFDIKLIALTGSVGKTTTKEFCANVTDVKYNAIRTDKNYNNDIGMPFTLFKLTKDTQAAVIEMGMSDFGEIELLSKCAKPHIAIITNVGTAHIEYLKSRDGILKAKSEIFSGMNSDGIAILNGDDDKLITLKGNISQKTIYFGINNKNCDYVANNIVQSNDGISFDINGKVFHIPIIGIHNVYNALCAYILGKLLSMSDSEIQMGFDAYKSDGIRQSIIKKNTYTIINDCYNASPQSTMCSLDVLKEYEGKRKIAVLGDMKELGGKSELYHNEVGEYFAKSSLDKLITFGPLSKFTLEGAKNAGFDKTSLFHFDTIEEITKHISETKKDGDVYLIKGSHSMRMEKISEALD